MVMIFSKLLGSRVAKIPTETCSVVLRAIVVSKFAPCALGFHSQVAVVLSIQPLIYQPKDAAETSNFAQIGQHQAQWCKFIFSD
jgi:hypothetical protein